VVYWTGQAFHAKFATFCSKEGRFRVEDAPLGDVFLFASSTDHPRSVAQHVFVAPEEPTRVTIELPGSSWAHGRIVDGNTHEPLGQASIQLYTNYGGQFLSAWGKKVAVGTDGGFRLRGFPPGAGRYMVECPGYETHLGAAFSIGAEEFDLGDIPLFAGRPWTLILRGQSGPPSAYTIACVSGTAFIAPHAFDDAGVARIESCAPGPYTMQVTGPDGSSWSHPVHLAPGEPWTTTIDLAGSTEMRVRVVSGTIDELSSEAKPTLSVSQPSASGTIMRRRIRAQVQEPQVLSGLLPGPINVTLLAEAGYELASVSTSLARGQLNDVELVVENRQSIFVVTDVDGQPLRGAGLTLSDASAHSGWAMTYTTDEGGRVPARRPPVDQVSIHVYDIVRGWQGDIEVDLSAWGDREIPVRFAPDDMLRIRVLDGDQPVTGVRVSIFYPSGEHAETQSPDSTGLVVWRNIVAKSLTLVASAPGYWGASTAVATSIDADHLTVIQLKRTGSAEVRVLEPVGSPVEGAQVDLECLELRRSIADWVSAGRVQASPGFPSTDGEGRLRIDGLPNGSYRCVVRAPDGRTSELALHVPRNDVARVDVRLP
jgi:hypothetical protein